jgi:hypothetical protein
MLSPAKLFRLLTELIFVLLGLFLVWFAVSGRLAFGFFSVRKSAPWIGLGAFLIYWGLRATSRAGRSADRNGERVRGGSLALVGVFMLGITWLPFPWVAPLLGAVGGVLALRGLAGSALAVRSSEK